VVRKRKGKKRKGEGGKRASATVSNNFLSPGTRRNLERKKEGRGRGERGKKKTCIPQSFS